MSTVSETDFHKEDHDARFFLMGNRFIRNSNQIDLLTQETNLTSFFQETRTFFCVFFGSESSFYFTINTKQLLL